MYEVKPNTIILGIEEASDDHRGGEGYVVKTNNGDILLAIERGRQCCEISGYCIECKEPDLDYYKGAKLVSVGDEPSMGGRVYDEEDNTTCLNIRTSKGDIDLWVYNRHNGYYSHSYLIKVQDYEKEGSL